MAIIIIIIIIIVKPKKNAINGRVSWLYQSDELPDLEINIDIYGVHDVGNGRRQQIVWLMFWIKKTLEYSIFAGIWPRPCETKAKQ